MCALCMPHAPLAGPYSLWLHYCAALQASLHALHVLAASRATTSLIEAAPKSDSEGEDVEHSHHAATTPLPARSLVSGEPVFLPIRPAPTRSVARRVAAPSRALPAAEMAAVGARLASLPMHSLVAHALSFVDARHRPHTTHVPDLAQLLMLGLPVRAQASDSAAPSPTCTAAGSLECVFTRALLAPLAAATPARTPMLSQSFFLEKAVWHLLLNAGSDVRGASDPASSRASTVSMCVLGGQIQREQVHPALVLAQVRVKYLALESGLLKQSMRYKRLLATRRAHAVAPTHASGSTAVEHSVSRAASVNESVSRQSNSDATPSLPSRAATGSSVLSSWCILRPQPAHWRAEAANRNTCSMEVEMHLAPRLFELYEPLQHVWRNVEVRACPMEVNWQQDHYALLKTFFTGSQSSDAEVGDMEQVKDIDKKEKEKNMEERDITDTTHSHADTGVVFLRHLRLNPIRMCVNYKGVVNLRQVAMDTGVVVLSRCHATWAAIMASVETIITRRLLRQSGQLLGFRARSEQARNVATMGKQAVRALEQMRTDALQRLSAAQARSRAIQQSLERLSETGGVLYARLEALQSLAHAPQRDAAARDRARLELQECERAIEAHERQLRDCSDAVVESLRAVTDCEAAVAGVEQELKGVREGALTFDEVDADMDAGEDAGDGLADSSIGDESMIGGVSRSKAALLLGSHAEPTRTQTVPRTPADRGSYTRDSSLDDSVGPLDVSEREASSEPTRTPVRPPSPTRPSR